MATPAQWLAGARPRTLPAAARAGARRHRRRRGARRLPPATALLALVVALALQVAVNYANDYSDGTRGTDADRVGPMRLVGSGAAPPRPVLGAAMLAFAVAAVAGLALAALTSWWLVAVGAVCILAAWTYTGGPIPYGYRALGEVFVFVFFGLVAVVGTTYVQTAHAAGAGLRRRRPHRAADRGDPGGQQPARHRRRRVVGKRTLAVLLGERGTRWAFAGLFVVALRVVVAVGVVRPWVLITLLAVPLAVPPLRTVLGGGRGPALIAALGGTGRLTLVTGVLLAAGLALSG